MNPCIDVTETIPRFVYGGLNRIQSRRVDMSGKGVNVAMALMQLGEPAHALGMCYKDNADTYLQGLAALGLSYDAVMAEGAVRENIKLLDLENAVTTEINQNGVPMDAAQLVAINARIDEVLTMKELTTFVLTGSVPPETPVDFYRQVIERGHAQGIRMMLDAEGDFLLEGIKAKPYLIKPNLFEFETAFAPPSTDIGTLVRSAREIIAGGVHTVCISMGEDGALLIDAQEALFCASPPCAVQSTQGAGDSLMAGICMALERELPMKEQLRYAVACAVGSLTREGTLLCTQKEFDAFYPLLQIVAVD